MFAYQSSEQPETTLPSPVNPCLDQQRCLLLKHSDGWHDDRCKLWLDAHGGNTETIVCNDGTNLPDAGKFSYVVIYGGMFCVNDADYQRCLSLEMKFIESVLKNNIPCFGICLGAQLIAHVLGASVKPLPCGTSEFGYSRITATGIGQSFMPQPCDMLQWHCDGFDLPQHCELLATGDVFANQAFRYNRNTFGVQFHPEVTPSVLSVWHQRASLDTRSNIDELQLHRQQRDCVKHANRNNIWLDHFMSSWVNS